MKVLISGFEAFGGGRINPSEQLVKLLQDRKFDFELETVLLPVSFGRSFELLREKIDQFQPDFVIGVGLAANRDEICVERIAINLVEARIPDNDGAQPVGEEIVVGGNDGLFATLPMKAMLQASLKAGVNCSISNTAGTYVCNELMYRILDYGRDRYQGGFVHIPSIPEMGVGSGAMELAEIENGIVAMLRVLGSSDKEVSVNTGSES